MYDLFVIWNSNQNSYYIHIVDGRFDLFLRYDMLWKCLSVKVCLWVDTRWQLCDSCDDGNQAIEGIPLSLTLYLNFVAGS